MRKGEKTETAEVNLAIRDKNVFLSYVQGDKLPPYRAAPVRDNDYLQNAQYEYLMRGDSISFGVLWSKFRTLCYKAIYAQIKRRGMRMTREDIDDAAECAAEYVMRRYSKWQRKGKEYVIYNFIESARFAVMHALWSGGERDIYSEVCSRIAGKRLEEVDTKDIVL